MMKPLRSFLYSLVCLLVWSCVLSAVDTLSAPANQNFNSASGPGISSRIIGDWQFRLLDANGDEDNGGYDFVDVIDDSYTNTTVLASGTDKALSLIGSVDVAVAAQIRSKDRAPFRLISFAMDGDDLTYLVTGYAAGLPVEGAVQSFFAPYYVETTVTLTNSAFYNIEEFRISRQDGVTDLWIYIDDIVVASPVASSAAPVIGNLNGDSAVFIEGGPAARLDTLTAATVTDSDSADFHGGAIVVGITGGRIPPQDALLIVHEGTGTGQVGVSGTNVTYGGTVVGSFRGGSSYDDLIIAFNSNASKTAAREIIRQLAYTNTSTGVPITSGRSISVRLYDGDGGYTSVTTSMAVQLNNVPPTITTATSTNVFNEGYNEPSLSVLVDGSVTIADSDSATLSNATVSITRNYSISQDRLLFTNNGSTMGNISATFETNSGVLTLTSAGASATIAEWRAALRAVSYLNISEAPSLAQRTVTFVVNDGSDFSDPATRAINIYDANDSPVNVYPAGVLTLFRDTPLTFTASNANGVSIVDPDAGNASIQVALNVSTGLVTLASIDGLSFLIGTGTDDPVVGMTGHITNINAALEGLVYTPPAGYSGPVTINIYTSDFGASGVGGHQSDSDNIEFTVLPPSASVVNVESTNANGIYSLNSSIFVVVRFDQNVVVDTNGGVPFIELSVGATNLHGASYLEGSGTDSLTFLYTVLAGHESPDLNYAAINGLVLNGGSISNVAASAANLTLPPPSSNLSLGGGRDLIVDGIVPTVHSITRVDSSPTSSTNLSFLVEFSESVSGVDVSDFSVATSGAVTGIVQNVTGLGGSSQSYTVRVGAVSGVGDLRLDINQSGTAIMDVAGQEIVGGFTNGQAYAVDTTAPAAPVFISISDDTGVDGDFVTADSTLVFRGTAEAGSSVTVSLVGSGVIGTVDSNDEGRWVFDHSSEPLPEGTNVFTAVAFDELGNTSPVSAPFAVVVDRSLRLSLLATPAVFTLKKAAVKVDAFALLDAGERAHFGGGQLVVSVITNRTSADQLSIYNDTNGGPGLRVSGTNVLWGDLLIAEASVSLPTVSNAVTFAFNTNATPSAVQALVREVAFSSTNASTLPRTVHFTLTDGFGTAAPEVFKAIVINKAAALPGVTNRFAHAVGTFSGLILRTNDVLAAESGSFQVKVTSRLGFSGSMMVAGAKTSFSGQFNTNGQASVITSGNKWGIDLTLSESTSTVEGRVTAYTAGGWTSDLVGHLTAAGTTNAIAAPIAPYTLSLPYSNDPEVGSGWATVTLARGGVAKLKGSLGDGQSWSASSLLGTNGYWPLYVSLDKKRGALVGWLVFSNSTPATFHGTLTWLKSATAPFFTNGIAAELDARVSRYSAPVGTNGVLSSTNIVVTIANGNLSAPLTNTVSVTYAGKFVRSTGSISNLTLTINAKAGSFSGGFVHPATGRAVKHSGVVLQSSDDGGGWFLGTNRGGVLRLNP